MKVPFDLDELKALVVQSVESSDFETALRLITDFVTDTIHDYRATANVYASDELDQLCIYIGRELNKRNPQIIKNVSEVQHNLVVYIVTELYNTGGHSAVIEDLIAYQPSKKHIILATNSLEKSHISEVQYRFLSPNILLEQAPSNGLYSKLEWLHQKITQLHPSQIILLNHHQDAVVIAAMNLDIQSQIIFYHHADHQLCLGVCLKNVIHIDPHPQGFYNCRNQLGIQNNFYLPLSAKDLGNTSIKREFLVDTKLKTCSSGNSGKFERKYRYSYSEIVPRVLEITKGSHIHIGPLSEKTLKNIKDGLQHYSIQADNFIHIPWAKSIWLALKDQQVDLYLESFPLGGGKTAIDVMGSGTPIIGHKNYQSRVLCCFDINYPEALCWNEPSQLYDILSGITPDFLLEQSLQARKHYEYFHEFEKVSQHFLDICHEKTTQCLLPLKRYHLNALQVFIDNKKMDEIIVAPLKSEIMQLQLEIQGMESSFFWKMRNHWFRLKHFFISTKNRG